MINIKYSIIIPHKNSSDLLERLLKSIPRNDCFQILVIDDYSTDAECKSIELLSKVYNFELYSNESKTAGGARNTGLKYAKGKWILFADSDDYYEPQMYSLLEKYVDSDYDIIFFNVTSRYSQTGVEAYRNEHVHYIAYNALKTGCNDYLKYCYTAPWGKMIKRTLITDNKIYFDEVIAGNDMWFSVNIGLAANDVLYDPIPLYCITVTQNSITTTLSKDRFESRLLVTLKVNNLLRKRKKDKYQISVLYFIAKSYQFGMKYMFHVWWLCIKNKSNLFVGLHKLLRIKSVLRDRQNTQLQ